MSLASLNRKCIPQRQQGAALILALMIVVLVVLVVTTLTTDFLVTFKRVENQLYSQQAYAYMQGAEGIAREQLQNDLEDDNTNGAIDHRSEGLYQRVEYPLDQGAIAGTLCDLQGFFNINNLPGSPPAGTQYTVSQEMFIRLLQTLELENKLDQSAAVEITQAVIDWIDPGSEVTSTGGAEDTYYADLDMPMRPGNQPLHRVSELRWVKGITPEIYDKLSPHLVALKEGTKLNINTASAVVLQTINDVKNLKPLDRSDADDIVSNRDGDISQGPAQQKAGFNDLKEFTDAHPLTTVDTSQLALNSEHFLLRTETIFMERKYRLYSMLHRDSDGLVKTVARGLDGLGKCEQEQIPEQEQTDS